MLFTTIIWPYDLNAMHKLAIPEQRYTGFTLKQLAESVEFTQHRKVQMSDEQHGIVTSFSGTKFIVDLVACTCTCGGYQVNNIPCGHAVACIVKLQKEPRNYIPEIFSLQKYLQPTTRTFYRRYCRVRSIFTLPSPHTKPSPWPAEGAKDTKGGGTAQQVSATSGWGFRRCC
jgi:hypothetical protein